MRVEIDCGEAGVQIFEAATEAELLEKLCEAQRNATIKIRDLAQRVRVLYGSMQTRRGGIWQR